jgi:2-dehydro-3-deoxygluconokinase
VDWFHFSAIAPAVSESAAALCAEALQAASKKNISISVDLNFRNLLWKYGKQPIDIMPGLVKYCNVIMGNIWAANTLLGIPLDISVNNNCTQVEYLTGATATAQHIFQQFSNCKWVANTFRFDGTAGDIKYYAALDTCDQQAISPLFQTDTVVDKVGSGDCFMAGLIYGILTGNTPENIIGFAAAGAFGKLQEKCDATHNSVAQIQNIFDQFV